MADKGEQALKIAKGLEKRLQDYMKKQAEYDRKQNDWAVKEFEKIIKQVNDYIKKQAAWEKQQQQEKKEIVAWVKKICT